MTSLRLLWPFLCAALTGCHPQSARGIGEVHAGHTQSSLDFHAAVKTDEADVYGRSHVVRSYGHHGSHLAVIGDVSKPVEGGFGAVVGGKVFIEHLGEQDPKAGPHIGVSYDNTVETRCGDFSFLALSTIGVPSDELELFGMVNYDTHYVGILLEAGARWDRNGKGYHHSLTTARIDAHPHGIRIGSLDVHIGPSIGVQLTQEHAPEMNYGFSVGLGYNSKEEH